MEAYIKVNKSLFYQIKEKDVFLLNTKKKYFKRAKALFVANIEDVSVITKEEFISILKKNDLYDKFN